MLKIIGILSLFTLEECSAGVYYKHSNGTEIKISKGIGKFATNFKAEEEALKLAAETLAESRDIDQTNAVLLTDCSSVILALQNAKRTDSDDLKLKLSFLY